MEKYIKSPKKIKQRRFLLVLPLLVLPFLVLMFWVLGGGHGKWTQDMPLSNPGYNVNLPDANLKDNGKGMDKMSYYEKARLDSARFKELIANDPNYSDNQARDSGALTQQREHDLGNGTGLNSSLNGSGTDNQPGSEKIYSKLAELEKEMNRQQLESAGIGNAALGGRGGGRIGVGEVNKLEGLMQTMGSSGNEDPELAQLSGMLEKIMDIQNPARIQEKMKQVSEKRRGEVFPVASSVKTGTVSLLEEGIQGATPSASGFYNSDASTELPQNAIQATVYQTQTLVNGSTIKLRLLSNVLVNGIEIPKNNFLFGVVALNGERLSIKINGIRYGNSLYPVDLSVCDLDGLDGIYIPGTITRDVAKQSADRSVQNLGLGALDPSFGAQAATAGIEAVKTLFSKKVTLIKVTVKAGYKVLLRDEKQKQNDSN